MKNSLAYKVIEDSAGGLHLFVFEDIKGDGDEKVIYEHSGYEYNKGQLLDDLKALANNGHPGCWDGCEDNPSDDYNFFMDDESLNYSIVASCDYGAPAEIDITIMGLSAQREFNVEA